MPALFVRGNEAVAINPADSTDFHLTEHGSDWLWAAFSLFALSTLVSVALSYNKPRSERLFYNINTIALLVMSVTYFTTASNLGWTSIQAEFNHVKVSNQTTEPGFRQIFYARFVGWFLAFPMFLVNYATLFSLDWSNLVFTVGTQWMTVIGLLIGSLIKSTYKWGYFTFGAFGFILEAVQLLWFFRRSANWSRVLPRLVPLLLLCQRSFWCCTLLPGVCPTVVMSSSPILRPSSLVFLMSASLSFLVPSSFTLLAELTTLLMVLLL